MFRFEDPVLANLPRSVKTDYLHEQLGEAPSTEYTMLLVSYARTSAWR